jgi:hypothetical protein
MSLPMFSKDGLTTLVFSRGHLYPVRQPETFRQLVAQSDAGTIRVATLSPPEQMLTLKFERLTATDVSNLRVWLHDPLIRGRASTFTFTDVDDTSYEVRFWQDQLDVQQVSFGLYNVELTLRVESMAW